MNREKSGQLNRRPEQECVCLDISVEEIHLFGTVNNVETSYFTPLKYVT